MLSCRLKKSLLRLVVSTRHSVCKCIIKCKTAQCERPLRRDKHLRILIFSLISKAFYVTKRYLPLCLLARCSRYLAFCLAEPLPCAPVMYCFFLALVFFFSWRSPLGAFLNTMPPPAIMSSMSIMVWCLWWRKCWPSPPIYINGGTDGLQ